MNEKLVENVCDIKEEYLEVSSSNDANFMQSFRFLALESAASCGEASSYWQYGQIENKERNGD